MANVRFRKKVRRYIAHPWLQDTFRLMYRVALAGMNYGGAGSTVSAGDELALARLARMRRGKRSVVFDVGANIGSYVSQTLKIVEEVQVYAFEPSQAAYERLTNAFGKNPAVHLVSMGVGAASGLATLWASVPGSVLGSTFVNPINGDIPGEKIELVCIDEFCRSRNIDRIDLLKLDLEGGELDALRGASEMLGRNAIDIIQFEFGQPSIGARTFFIDLFELLTRRYEIYRVLPNALERLDAYHETLEVFMSTNYVAVLRARLAEFHR